MFSLAIEERGAGRLVRLLFANPVDEVDEAAYLGGLADLARVPGPFALIAELTTGRRLSAAGERAQALWFKASRGAIEHACCGIAIVRPGGDERMATAFRKLWRLPILVTGDRLEAERWALERLDRAGVT